MVHNPYIRLVPGADTAVMFIHGIAGTPNHFRDLIPLVELVPETWSVYNVLLPGHGGSVKDFAYSSGKLWKAHVREVFEELSDSHERVVLVGHSMGTLFSIQLALEFPDKIPLLFLLAVPMRPYVALQAINNSLRLAFGKLRPNKPMEAAIGTACGCTPTRILWKYLGWIPRFIDLFLEIHHTEKVLGAMEVPAIVFQSRRDELVMASAARVLRQKGIEDVRILPSSGHFYYHPEDSAAVRKEFALQIKRRLD